MSDRTNQQLSYVHSGKSAGTMWERRRASVKTFPYLLHARSNFHEREPKCVVTLIARCEILTEAFDLT